MDAVTRWGQAGQHLTWASRSRACTIFLRSQRLRAVTMATWPCTHSSFCSKNDALLEGHRTLTPRGKAQPARAGVWGFQATVGSQHASGLEGPTALHSGQDWAQEGHTPHPAQTPHRRTGGSPTAAHSLHEACTWGNRKTAEGDSSVATRSHCWPWLCPLQATDALEASVPSPTQPGSQASTGSAVSPQSCLGLVLPTPAAKLLRKAANLPGTVSTLDTHGQALSPPTGSQFPSSGPIHHDWPHCRVSPRGSRLLPRNLYRNLPTWNLYISPLRMLLSTVPPKMYMASEMTAAAWKSLPLGSWVERGQVSRVGQGRARSLAGGWLRPEAGQAVTKDVTPLDWKGGREHSYRHRAEGRAYGSEWAGPARDPRSAQSRYLALRAAPRGPGQQGVNSWASAHLLCDLDKYLSESRSPYL